MCNRKDCIYCEIIELPTYSKMFIHYNSLFIPIWIEFLDGEENSFSYFREIKLKKGEYIELSSINI